MSDFPSWFFYPARAAPPEWVRPFLSVVQAAQLRIDSSSNEGLTSDRVLGHLAPGLADLGYAVELSKSRVDKIRRPVLFGDQGRERVAYEVDAFHDELGVAVEVEAGRGARGNAVYRDLVRTSLIVGARFLALGVMGEYRHQTGGKTQRVPSYRDAKDQLDAIYASGRLVLPFGHLPYHRAWVLEQATRSPFICSTSDISRAVRSAPDELTTRYGAMAMWAKGEYSWFQSRRGQFQSLQPWVRRAFLVGSTCLPGDESQHFIRAVQGGLSSLERIIVAWARTDEPAKWRRSLAS